MRLFDIVMNTLKDEYSHTGPVLDCTFIDKQRIASVGSNKEVKV